MMEMAIVMPMEMVMAYIKSSLILLQMLKWRILLFSDLICYRHVTMAECTAFLVEMVLVFRMGMGMGTRMVMVMVMKIAMR